MYSTIPYETVHFSPVILALKGVLCGMRESAELSYIPSF